MRRILSLFTMLMFCGVLAFGQSRVVTGKVVDDKGNAVPLASIKVKGGRTGISAGSDGSFRLSIPNDATLSVSATGFIASEVEAKDNMTITLFPDDTKQVLTEVVITAAGIKRSEKTTGYAISKVDPEVLLQKSEPDILKGLQGKVAGVDIAQGQGTPGAAARIRIRGNNSFGGDNNPLIIVDGIPYSNAQVNSTNTLAGGAGAYGSGLANLDPNDIASMSILKGASASALYGSRASNGVIIITTKSGSPSRSTKGTQLNFKTGVSLENIANLPAYQNLYGTGSQGNPGGGSNGSWGGRFGTGNVYSASGAVLRPSSSGVDSVSAWAGYLAAYPELFDANGRVAYKAYPSNVKDQFTTGVVVENSLNVTTGDKTNSFSFTGSDLRHSGYVPNNEYTRTSIAGGGASKLDIGLNVRANFSYSRSKQEGGLFGNNQSGTLTNSQFARALFMGRSWDFGLPFETKEGNSISWLGSQFDHPFWAAKYNTATAYDERTVAGVHLDYKFNDWLQADYNVGSNVASINREEILEVSSRGISQGTMTLLDNRRQEIESTFLLSITPKTGNDFTIKTTLGTSFNQRTSTTNFATGGRRTGGGGFIVRGLHTIQNFLPIDKTNSETYSRRRLLGVFGDLTLGYKNFAFLTLTGRNDISSTLPADNRSYFYPSISGSFIFSDAFNMKGGILDYGKIRAGYAKVGKDADPYNIFNTFAVAGNAFLGQPYGQVNPDANAGLALQPEFTKELELGTQLSFFKRRFELDFTYYDKRSDNLLTSVSTPPSSGFSSVYINFGSIKNEGVEIEATVRPIRTKDFTWEVRGVFTKNKNTVTQLAPGIDFLNLGGGYTDITTGLQVGQPFGFLYGSKVLRDSASGQFLIDPSTGTPILDPENGYLGNPAADFKLGITNTFSYKGLYLNALFDYTEGGSLYSVTVQSLLGRGVTLDTEDRETGWVIPGIYGDAVTGSAILNGGKTIPNQTRITTNDLYFSPNGGNTFAINTANEFSVYDATVYRLRELTLGYDFPKSMFQNSRVSGVSFSISARNLWYLAPGFPKYTNFDPEVGSYGSSSVTGLEFSAAPTTRRMGVNLNVTF